MVKNKEVRRYISLGVIITAIVGVAAYIFKLPAFIAVVIEGVLLFCCGLSICKDATGTCRRWHRR